MRERTIVLAIAVLAAVPLAAAAPSGDAVRDGGRLIYERGASPSGGTIRARVGMGTNLIPAAAVPCGSCHGEDGLGRPEGGVRPSNIRWSELTKPYERQHENGRRNGPYDERLLRRAVLAGIDSSGNELDRAMPRYEMSDADMTALLAYLRELEHRIDPGMGEGVLRIGTLLPLEGRLAPAGRAVRGVLEAYFETLNEGGGIHGRRLELVVEPLPGEPAGAAQAARRLIASDRVFALLAPLSARIEDELARAAEAERMPVLGPVTLFPEDAHASSLVVFHVLAGVPELAQVLATHVAASRDTLGETMALLHPENERGVSQAEAAERKLRELGYRVLVRVPYAPGARGEALAALAQALKQAAVARVLLLGPGLDASGLARAAAAVGHAPQWLVPGPLAPRDVLDWPDAYRDRILLAYPTLPQDQQPFALRAYAALYRDETLDRAHQPLQVAAYSAALLLVEGLKRAGRGLSRRKLIAALEGVQDFQLGMVPAVSYNANRRIGALGGYVVAVDVRRRLYRPLGDFVRLP